MDAAHGVMVFCGQIIDMSGGRTLSAAMRDMAVDYLFYCCAFSILMLMSTCLPVFVRNDGSPALSFAGICVSAGANIFLDWLFVFPMDMGVFCGRPPLSFCEETGEPAFSAIPDLRDVGS